MFFDVPYFHRFPAPRAVLPVRYLLFYYTTILFFKKTIRCSFGSIDFC